MRPIKPDGLETPGLVWQRRSKRRHGKAIPSPDDPYVGYWQCRSDIAARKFKPETQRLWPRAGDPFSQPGKEDWEVIAATCTRLQDEMLTWANGGVPPARAEFDAKRMFDGSFGSLVDLFLRDPDSPFHNNRFGTRKTYRSRVLCLKKMVGEARITPVMKDGPKITFRDFNRWVTNWSKPRVEGGAPRPARAHGYMAFVRILISYGVMAELPRCDALKAVLAEMEFTAPKKRSQVVNREQAILIIEEAHRRELHSIAFAQALMSDLLVRQKDAIGEWLPLSEPGLSDITDHGEKWLNGFRWEEIENGVLDHRLSKSLRGKDAVVDPGAGKALPFTLALYPLVMAEIERVPEEDRHGPMIKADRKGVPWRQKRFAVLWREIATAVGVPTNVQNRDSRAGGGSDAEKKGATREQIRPAFGHSKVETTDIYLRNEREGPDNIARIRFGGDEKQ